MPPMPLSMVDTASERWTVPKSSVTESPAARPTAMETPSRATKGCSRTLMIRKRSSAMPRAATVSRPAVPSTSRSSPPVWGGVPSAAEAASGRRNGWDMGGVLWVRAWGFRAGGIATRRPGGCGTPCRPAAEGSYGGSAEDGERVELDEEAGGQAHVDGGAGRRGLGEALLLEVGVVQVVHLGEVVDVGEVD